MSSLWLCNQGNMMLRLLDDVTKEFCECLEKGARFRLRSIEDALRR
jgi:hypothetical protein